MAAGPASIAAQPADPTAMQNRQDQKETFLKSGSTETRNGSDLRRQASSYQIMAGTVIPVALVTRIQSDLPGDVIGKVTEIAGSSRESLERNLLRLTRAGPAHDAGGYRLG